MIGSPEPIKTALRTTKGQRRMTVRLRRMEIISEIAFLTSLAVTLCGWLVVAPEWQPLVRAIMPLGLGLIAMRRTWRYSLFVLLLNMAAIPLFPGGLPWDVFLSWQPFP